MTETSTRPASLGANRTIASPTLVTQTLAQIVDTPRTSDTSAVSSTEHRGLKARLCRKRKNAQIPSTTTPNAVTIPDAVWSQLVTVSSRRIEVDAATDRHALETVPGFIGRQLKSDVV